MLLLTTVLLTMVVLKFFLFYNVYFLFLPYHCSFLPSLLVSLVSSTFCSFSCSFFYRINKFFIFFKAFFKTVGKFRESIFFFRSSLILITIWRTESGTTPSVSSWSWSELTVSIQMWNINRNLCISCSLISISRSISFILLTIFSFSNLISFLSWFSSSSYLKSVSESSLF